MNVRKLLNGVIILTLLLPALLAGSAAPMRASGSLKPLIADEATESLSLAPFSEAVYEERSQTGEHEPAQVPSASISDFSASVLQPTAGSHTWDTDADFAGGAFDHTEVVSGTGQVTLLRRWTANVRANDDIGPESRGNPSLAVGDGGVPYLAWADNRNMDYDIYFARSDDGGATWSANLKINDDTGSGEQSGPSLAVDGSGNLYLAWVDNRNGDYDIYFARSIDGGTTWSTNLKVNDDIGSAYPYEPSLAVDGSGNLYLAWMDFRGGDSDVYSARSTDSGATWSANVQVNDDTGSADQGEPSLAVDGSGNLYLAWPDNRNGDWNIYFARSTDSGATWSANLKVNDDTGSDHQDYTSLVVDENGNAYVAWRDDRNWAFDIYFARSSDSGTTWSTNVQVNDDADSAWQESPNLAVNRSGNLYLAWKDDRNDGLSGDIYFARSTDSGATWSANLKVNDDTGSAYQNQPSLAVDGGGNIYVAWEDGRSGNAEIYTSRWPDNAHFYTDGTVASEAYDAGALVAWNSLAWTDTLLAGTALTMTARAGNSATPDASWSEWVTFTTSPADLSSLPATRYLQWKASLTSPVSTATPSLDAVTVSWSDSVDYTEVGGFIDTDTTWTEAESPYLVTDNVLVFEGATLTVEPGVTVWFSDTHVLQVLGGLVARGTPAQPIRFTSTHVQGQPDDWGGIVFGSTATGATFDADGNYLGGSALQYATVEYAGWGSLDYAVDALDTAVYVDHCTIRHNGSTGLRAAGDGGFITENYIHDNGGDGIRNSGPSATISGNSVIQNGNSGIWNNGSSATINGNTVTGNGASGIYNGGSSTTIRVNSAAQNGGSGISNDGSSVTIDGNTATDNNGSGIRNGGDSATITDNNAAQNGGSGIDNGGSSTTISGNSAVGNGNSGIINSGSPVSIHGNTVSANTGGYGGGIYWAGSGDIAYNTIISNSSTGGVGGIYVSQGYYPTIHHNTIEDNQGYDLYNNNDFSTTRLDARYNWWGTADEGVIQGMIFDWWDHGAKGLVDYSPYLTERPDLEPAGINVSGPAAGLVDVTYSFDASVYPLAAIPPLTYTWETAGQAPVTHVSDDLDDTASFAWTTTGPKMVAVTVHNSEGMAQTTYGITITESSSHDAYEVDDACAQAQAITTGGEPQVHTFHAPGDVDWVTFYGIGGRDYLIEALVPDDSTADVNLALYETCSGSPSGDPDNAFGPSVSLSFTAPQDGPLFLRLTDDRDTFGAGAAVYQLSVRDVSSTAMVGVGMVVAGRNKTDDTLQSNIYNVTNAVYRLFRDNGYGADDIYYLAPADQDADGGGNDVDVLSTKANLQQAITEWVSDTVGVDQAFTLYMMDHGSYDGFYLNYLNNQPQPVSAHELDGWLDELAAARPDVKINVIVEACHSGSFIDLAETLSGPGRVVIASTGAYRVAYASQDGAVFSDAFVAALGQGKSLFGGFEEARWAVQQAHPFQTPWLDDDGDGIPNDPDDGPLAAQRWIGAGGGALWPPHIAWAVMDQGMGTIEAEVGIEAGQTISEAWALVYPPSYEPPESGEDLETESIPRVDLAGPEAGGVYAGGYSFTEPGTYRVVVYGVDMMGLDARPREAVLGGVPVLSISKAGPADAEAGEPITYTLTVFNNGTVEASNLVITDSIPIGASYVSGGTRVGDDVHWTVPNLAAGGGSVQLTFVVIGTGTIVNDDYRVTADGGFGAAGQVPVMTVVEEAPVLVIGKAGPVAARGGEPITYTLTVTNSGSVAATNLVITDALPGGAHYVQAGAGTLLLPGETVRWEVPSLAGGGGVTSVQFAVTATATIVNDDYRVSADEGVSAVGAVPVVTAVDEPVLSIGKEGPPSADAGEPITYTLTVINRGVVTATNLVITDGVPSGAHFVDAGVGTLLLPGGIVRWERSDLTGYGGMVVVRFVVTATEMIVNDDYRVSADGGFSAVGSAAVVTIIGPKVYLPLVMRNH